MRKQGFTLVLLIVAGLMIRTFVAMRQVQPGFVRPEKVHQCAANAHPRSARGGVLAARASREDEAERADR